PRVAEPQQFAEAEIDLIEPVAVLVSRFDEPEDSDGHSPGQRAPQTPRDHGALCYRICGNALGRDIGKVRSHVRLTLKRPADQHVDLWDCVRRQSFDVREIPRLTMAIGPGPLGSRLHGRKRAAAAWWNVDFRNALADLTIVFRHVARAEAAL